MTTITSTWQRTPFHIRLLGRPAYRRLVTREFEVGPTAREYFTFWEYASNPDAR